jgi:hypothetical protein
MIEKLLELTDDGRGVFIAASRPSSLTNQNYGIVTVNRGAYGEFIAVAKREYGCNPFHLRKFIDPSLLKKAILLHRNVRCHQISLEYAEDEVLDTIRALSPVYYESKGFSLIDICEFSKKSTAEQISHKLILEAALAHATKTLFLSRSPIIEDRHLEFSFHSTGDGFYIWSNSQGRHADSILLTHLLFTIGFLNRRKGKFFDIEVRAAFGIGEAYLFPRLNGLFPSDGLGDALNDVARLVSFAARNQLLIQEFASEKIYPNSISNSFELVKSIPELLSDKYKSYLTLDDMAELLWAEDKHRKRHYFRNLNGDIFTFIGNELNSVRVGIEKETATQFDPNKYSNS